MFSVPKRFLAVVSCIAVFAFSALCIFGCAQQEQEVPENLPVTTTPPDSGLYFTHQDVRQSPEWVANLEVAQEANQIIVVAGVGKATAYVSMHQKGEDGVWYQLIATPGFIGSDGLGEASANANYTPVGTFAINRAFGLAPNPGCKIDYVQADDTFYWSGDPREGMHYNRLVSINELPDLDTAASKHISDNRYPYQYVLSIDCNSKNDPEKGYAYFLHGFGLSKPYTDGSVAVPEDIMLFMMQHVEPGCIVTIDSLENFGGDLNA